MPHLFEFMDEQWVPKTLRDTLREGVEMVCSPPIRPYDRWVAEMVRQAARAAGCRNIVELGAGTAPVTRCLATQFPEDRSRLIPCDISPDVTAYQGLERQFPERVAPVYEPVDFAQARRWPPNTLVFLSATFHHIPSELRRGTIDALTKSADRVLIVEPLRKTAFAVAAVSLDWFFGLLLPLWFLNRPGKIRRFVWCWAVPVAPIMFVWDAVISCLRQWTEAEWETQLQGLDLDESATIEHGPLSQMVTVARSASDKAKHSAPAKTERFVIPTV